MLSFDMRWDYLTIARAVRSSLNHLGRVIRESQWHQKYSLSINPAAAIEPHYCTRTSRICVVHTYKSRNKFFSDTASRSSCQSRPNSPASGSGQATAQTKRYIRLSFVSARAHGTWKERGLMLLDYDYVCPVQYSLAPVTIQMLI